MNIKLSLLGKRHFYLYIFNSELSEKLADFDAKFSVFRINISSFLSVIFCSAASFGLGFER
jgi:hypothetical protein